MAPRALRGDVVELLTALDRGLLLAGPRIGRRDDRRARLFLLPLRREQLAVGQLTQVGADRQVFVRLGGFDGNMSQLGIEKDWLVISDRRPRGR